MPAKKANGGLHEMQSRRLREIIKRFPALRRPGNDLLSQVLRHSTIGAEAFDGRVRDGIGSYHFARVTRPAKGRIEATCDAGASIPGLIRESRHAALVLAIFAFLRIISSEKSATFLDDAMSID